MPEFTHRDRLVLNCEQALWTVTAILQEECKALGDTTFGEELEALRKRANDLAKELQQYNDQFEVEE